MPVRNSDWTKEELIKLYNLRKEGTSFRAIAKTLGRTNSVHLKYYRVDWNSFFKDPDNYMTKNNAFIYNRWTETEMTQLDAYLQSGKSYDFIAEKLNRTVSSIEKKSQETDWKSWRQLGKRKIDLKEDKEENDEILDQLKQALLNVCRNDFSRINAVKEDDFLQRINLDKEKFSNIITFQRLKEKAIEELNSRGFGNPENVDLGPGRYVIVGDSHGKYTKKGVFAMLREVNKYLKPNNIIHIGHLLDDDNDISYEWGDFKNLIVLSKIEELKLTQEQRHKFKFKFDMVRESINIGGLVIFNQDLISDYITTSIRNLDTQILDDKVIVNLHRLEFHTKPCHSDVSYLASPGCLCERHIVRTIKQLNFTDGKIVKQAFWDGFSKYRRMRHTNKYWEMGMLVVEIDEEGNHTVIPCQIKKTDKGFTTSYFDKLISSTGVFNPEEKTFINGDLHCDKHDVSILDVQEKICKDYKPNNYVNVGDSLNYSSLNHHVMDRGGVIIDKKLLSEAAQAYFILKRLSSWAKNKYIICGNHERFARDFVEKYPQFGEYLDFKFLCDVEDIGYKVIPLKRVLKIGAAKFIHGEMKMYGQNGDKLEKAARTFGRDVFIGHIHCPVIRFGCYSIGLSGLLDQDYNEPDASGWIHGFGLCNHYKNKCWSTTIAIVDNRCIINKKTYLPKDIDSWKMPKYNVRLRYQQSFKINDKSNS